MNMYNILSLSGTNKYISLLLSFTSYYRVVNSHNIENINWQFPSFANSNYELPACTSDAATNAQR